MNKTRSDEENKILSLAFLAEEEEKENAKKNHCGFITLILKVNKSFRHYFRI
jgi:hypothetical protein